MAANATEQPLLDREPGLKVIDLKQVFIFRIYFRNP